MSNTEESETDTPRTARIVLVGPAHPYRGGIAHFLEHLDAGLSERGADTTLVTFSRQYPEVLFPGKTQLVEPGVNGPHAHRLIDSINPLSWSKASRFIVGKNPDVVIIKYWIPFLAPALGFIARKVRASGAKVVVVVHNALPHERRPGDLLLSRYLLRQADGVIAMSRKVKDDLERVVGLNVPVALIPHPIYDNFGPASDRATARSALDLDPARPILLFFGFIRKYKGLDILLDALPAVRAALPNIQLVVAGEFYDDEEAYRNQVRANGLESAVQFHSNYIPDATVGTYFSACDLVVQPYRTATQSGVAQVAFQFDRPVVVTDVGGLSEIVPNGKVGFVVPPEDPGALADAIVQFFADNRARDMEDAVRLEKQKYSWDGMYEEIESFVTR